ncbi:hypothetical protein LUW75_15960 [Streptomyces sp. MRC013]|uniref:hypothetical protein n=1 Tax=Streptomyces sp. MRC013 TaxID=2898276 RepID=UPI0020263282|nr:hypothetical protein [Streptomyces sp. MRC013]URM91224.1 hypothetical protein LUW75_15960 [Streptomyces sp. MRC013]
MRPGRTKEQIAADARQSGRTQECESGEHEPCTPVEVYESDSPGPDERPFFSFACTCTCRTD